MSKILQNTPEWIEAKQSKISASEIYTLIHHYCWQELKDMGFDLLKERPFRTIQELFLKVKFGAKLSEIDPVHSEFGQGMEGYIAYRLKYVVPELEIERSKDFILNEKMHPLAACSPDGTVLYTAKNTVLPDFDNTCEIEQSWGKGALELKTSNYFANFDQGGSRLQYLFQLQYQIKVMGLKWGCLAVLLPKEKEFDEPFFKGRILEKVEFFREEVDQYYDLKHYIYPELPVFQNMIMKAICKFQEDLDLYDIDQSRFPRNCEDLAGLQREKQLWAQLWPEHYGKKQLEEDDELDKLFNDRYHLQEAKMFAEQDFDKITNEIYQKVKARGLEKFTEITGTKHRMTFIKNGQVRFYKLKEAKE